MKNPNIKTKVVHSKSQDAWNVINVKLGGKYKISRIPYVTSDSEMQKQEALLHAEFISNCFNKSDEIVKLI